MIFFRRVSFLLGLAALTLLGSAVCAKAETISNSSDAKRLETTTPIENVEAATSISDLGSLSSDSTLFKGSVEPTVAPTKAASLTVEQLLASNRSTTDAPQDTTAPLHLQPDSTEAVNQNAVDSQKPSSDVALNEQPTSAQAADKTVEAPTPGTAGTSAALLTAQPELTPAPEAPAEATTEADTTVAQSDIDPGRPTRGGASYIGIGGNIGIDGDTALGRGSFVINSKIGLTRTLSVRPSAFIGDDTVFLIPLTYDFSIRSTDPFEPVRFAPFLGGGVAISTDEDDNFGFVVTGGVDVPLSSRFVANAALNVGFIEDTTDFGIMVGVGYTFVDF